MMHIVLATCLAIVLTTYSHAASVWKVSSGKNTMYLGGTLHLLSKSDYPLPAPYQQAYEQSSVLVFETDLDATQTPAFQKKAMMVMTYSDGTTIKQALSQDTYDAVAAHLQKRNIPLAHVQSFKPNMLSMTLSLIEMQRHGLTSAGVDQHYADKAKSDGKMRRFLETPDEQLSFLASLGEEDGDALVRYTLRDLKDIPVMLDKMKTFWRAGDMPALADSSITPLQQDYPQVYEDLLVDRNNTWIPQLIRMMQTPQTEFVLVGALHMAGEHSVLVGLRSAGFQVEMLR